MYRIPYAGQALTPEGDALQPLPRALYSEPTWRACQAPGCSHRASQWREDTSSAPYAAPDLAVCALHADGGY